ncbi:hypothetical protein ABZZ80_14845 [Streptomyces sp. NPDC006356]
MDSSGHRDGAALEPGQLADPLRVRSCGEGWQQDGGSAVAVLAGEFGAELVRAIRVGLSQGAEPAYGSRGPSRLSWYAFAIKYAQAHWPGRAAKTRDEASEALTAVTLAMLWDIPGRPNEQLLRRALRRWAFVVPGPEQRELPAQERLLLLGVPPLGEGGEGIPATGGPARSDPGT